ncbi:histidine phosphatase family protein [Acetobacter conturbans]|uniref:Phosphoglycerate mutase n=1 Tax=Acetobacter conturbans TaxID=1737472 RepID=A0ABX0JUF3_9PROT|nr:histidine phosphatase family protein [Acetobacter conturbans]NHN87128.1 hypothetical protein [Acetobacter conturbans]
MSLTLTCFTLAVGAAAKKGVMTSCVEMPDSVEWNIPSGTVILCADTLAHELPKQYPALVRGVAALRGQDFGLWEGRSLKSLSPEELLSLTRDIAFVPPGGESRIQFFERVKTWFYGLPEHQPSAVIMAGPAVMRALVLSVLGCPPETATRLDIESGSHFMLTRHGHWRLRLT